jgi:hypothetical protein
MALRSRLPWNALALAACAAGCASSASSAPVPAASSTAPAPRVFIGEVTGSDARVGVVATDHHARIYVCGGDASYTTMTHWLPSVPIDVVRGALSQDGGTTDWSVEAQVSDSGVSGSLAVAGGATFPFHAERVAAGTIAGLYEAVGACGKIGLIVTQGSSSETPLGQGACLPVSGAPNAEQVNPIRPIDRAADGTISVVVDGAPIVLRPAAAPAD